MKLSYDRATDFLYVLFIDRPGADVIEVAPCGCCKLPSVTPKSFWKT